LKEIYIFIYCLFRTFTDSDKWANMHLDPFVSAWTGQEHRMLVSVLIPAAKLVSQVEVELTLTHPEIRALWSMRGDA